jgi:hypothetical protein
VTRVRTCGTCHRLGLNSPHPLFSKPCCGKLISASQTGQILSCLARPLFRSSGFSA